MALVFVQIARRLRQVNNFKVLDYKFIVWALGKVYKVEKVVT